MQVPIEHNGGEQTLLVPFRAHRPPRPLLQLGSRASPVSGFQLGVVEGEWRVVQPAYGQARWTTSPPPASPTSGSLRRPTLSASKATCWGGCTIWTRPIIEAFHGKGVQRVQRELIGWLDWLKMDIGFDAWRLDFAKGYSADMAKIYIDATEPSFAVAEIWTSMANGGDGKPNYDQNAHRQELVNWVNRVGGANSNATAFDFTTKGILNVAVESDRAVAPPRRGRQGARHDRVVAGQGDDLRRQPRHRLDAAPVAVSLRQGYAYILTHPGNPCIFYDHFFDWGLKDEIERLVSIRNRQGIHPARGRCCWLLPS
ncbi:hypothetical protein OsJ_01730 [Oryza sativa Japonica Group]|uniref:1,4-alpha-D-glucan glucanohydrolase n=1 Tax=Oryza sativa subsp. japonica TaxID=39947 RepID=B9EWP4_ORYSJ|nr:hypothetical protein OsJ_01730 [Oryza sativa Japonica Group]